MADTAGDAQVNNDEYTEVHEVYLDIMQVWRNCFKFNKNFSKPYKAGLHLKALSESTWKGYGLAVSSRSPLARLDTLQQRPPLFCLFSPYATAPTLMLHFHYLSACLSVELMQDGFGITGAKQILRKGRLLYPVLISRGAARKTSERKRKCAGGMQPKKSPRKRARMMRNRKLKMTMSLSSRA